MIRSKCFCSEQAWDANDLWQDEVGSMTYQVGGVGVSRSQQEVAG